MYATLIKSQFVVSLFLSACLSNASVIYNRLYIYTVPADPTHSWTVSLDCSKPDEVMVRYSDYSGQPGSPVAEPVEHMSVFEIRLQCTDGNDEVGIPAYYIVHPCCSVACYVVILLE